MDTRTKVIIGTVVAVVIVAAALAFTMLSPREQPQPTATPTLVATAAPTPAVAATSALPGVFEEHHEEAAAQDPVLTKVPKITPYWTAEILKDRRDGKVVITVTVYVLPGQNAEQIVAAQRQHVEAWLDSIGQKAGTYELDFKAERPDTY